MGTAHWTLPTTYADGSIIPSGSLLVTHIFLDGVEVGVSSPGAVEMDFDVVLEPGKSYEFTGKCEVSGVPDALSAPSDPFVYFVPFPVVSPPSGLSFAI
jgi:hypothetical protein